MAQECGCDYSWTCSMHREIFELQAKEERLRHEAEEERDALQKKIESLEHRIERLEGKIGLTR